MQDKQENNVEKKPSKFKSIFVHNLGWKVLALVSAAVIWALAAGLL